MAILKETSDCTPALANFKERLFIAWKGQGNHQLNVMSSSDGVSWKNKKTFDEYTFFEPALAVFRGKLYLGWTGTDRSAMLNVQSTEDGVNWTDKITIDEYSRYGPGLRTFKDRLYLAWTGVDHLSQVNVLSSADGEYWNSEDKVTLSEHSSASPALVAVADADADATHKDVLYLGWTGTDFRNHLNLIRSTNGYNFVDKIIFSPDSLNGQIATSLQGPALSVQSTPNGSNGSFPKLEITWTHRCREGSLRNLEYPQPNQDKDLKIKQPIENLAGTSIAAPASAEFGPDETYIAWTGTDENHCLNVAKLSDMSEH